jgi:protein-tyrosine phosphatase
MFQIEAPTVGRLAILPRPRPEDWLDRDVAIWRTAGFNAVLSLLELQEAKEVGLEQEAEACGRAGLAFASYPIADRGVPNSVAAVEQWTEWVIVRLRRGENVGLHCRAGIGRSGMMAACVLVRLGVEPGEAFEAVSVARGLRVPDTEEQRRWVYSFQSTVIPTLSRSGLTPAEL